MSNDTPRVNLLTLAKSQSSRIKDAMQEVEDASDFLNALLAMVKPEGATGFDQGTMTFYTEPQTKEPEE